MPAPAPMDTSSRWRASPRSPSWIPCRLLPATWSVCRGSSFPQIVIHPTCSSERLNTTADLVALAQHVADDVLSASDWACCAFAGHRGMLFLELTASAITEMATEIRGLDADAYVSCNRTCEIGMTRATEKDYANILETMEWATRDDDVSMNARGA